MSADAMPCAVTSASSLRRHDGPGGPNGGGDVGCASCAASPSNATTPRRQRTHCQQPKDKRTTSENGNGPCSKPEPDNIALAVSVFGQPDEPALRHAEPRRQWSTHGSTTPAEREHCLCSFFDYICITEKGAATGLRYGAMAMRGLREECLKGIQTSVRQGSS